MPGNYSITTRTDGETLTAAKYNADHQNHVDNLEPAKVDDYSATTTQMRAQADPGESGTESLPTTLAGELERLRFAIAEIRGTSYWYQSTVTKHHDASVILRSTTANPAFPNDIVSGMAVNVRLPNDYAGGDVSGVLVLHAQVGTGVVVFTGAAYASRNGGGITTIFSGDKSQTDPGANLFTIVFTFPAANVQAGDFLRFDLARDGGHGSDTLDGWVEFRGAYIEYTGYAGRL